VAVDGLIAQPSAFGAKATLDRLASEVERRGMTVFARVDHAAGAKTAGLELRPTELLIFGAAKGGTALMQADQTMGIDLPLKALAWEDAEGKSWLAYEDPAAIAGRHGLGDAVAPTIAAMTATLKAVAGAAAAP
jgi:uncharacterized protein (DUF302 family)